jgi:hypothetical protein
MGIDRGEFAGSLLTSPRRMGNSNNEPVIVSVRVAVPLSGDTRRRWHTTCKGQANVTTKW